MKIDVVIWRYQRTTSYFRQPSRWIRFRGRSYDMPKRTVEWLRNFDNNR